MSRELRLYILLSLAGLLFLFLLYLYTPQTTNPYKLVFIIIFVLICFMGIIAAIYPIQCMSFKEEKYTKSICKNNTLNKNNETEYRFKNRILKIEGHHPDCGEFQDHIYTFYNKKLCVGCSGLLIGSVMAIFTVMSYIIYGTSSGLGSIGGFIFYLGVAVTSAALLLLIFLSLKIKLVRFISNLSLVWGSSLVLIGLLEYRNIFLSIYFLFLVLVWIMTRSAVSRRNHQMICQSCI